MLNALKTLVIAQIPFSNLSGFTHPRNVVAGVNRHAGEHGLFGEKAITIVVPAMAEMKSTGIYVNGPCPPDTVFLRAWEDKYDRVVVMYHDLGHIQLKLLGFYGGVNITAGLPLIRRSTDQGTAFDTAGQEKPGPGAWRSQLN